MEIMGILEIMYIEKEEEMAGAAKPIRSTPRIDKERTEFIGLKLVTKKAKMLIPSMMRELGLRKLIMKTQIISVIRKWGRILLKKENKDLNNKNNFLVIKTFGTINYYILLISKIRESGLNLPTL